VADRAKQFLGKQPRPSQGLCGFHLFLSSPSESGRGQPHFKSRRTFPRSSGMDDVTIWNRVLSAEEIQLLAGQERTLLTC
jgi:hypothetical protein